MGVRGLRRVGPLLLCLVSTLAMVLSLGCEQTPQEVVTKVAIETEDPRFEIWLTPSLSGKPSDARQALSLRLEAKKGWHMTPEAPTQLDLSAPTGFVMDAPTQRIEDALTSSAERLEFEVAFRPAEGQPAQEGWDLHEVYASGELKFGVCRDGNPRCEIVKRKLKIPLILE